MLKPIPEKILKHEVTFQVCSGVDAWQNPSYDSQVVKSCCVQPSSETRKTKDNTEVVLRALLFIDARYSSPASLDIEGLKDTSESNGHALTVIFNGRTYTVESVDVLYDDEGIYHHSEVGLV